MQQKVCKITDLKKLLARAKSQGKKVVFTNGCFDLLHRGHLHLLREAKKLGDLLVVGLNSDSSVKAIKGPNRPILPESDRAELIAALEMVDYVVLFSDPDPHRLIQELRPDVLVKGGDWAKEAVVGADIVESTGGTVAVVPYLGGYSTTEIIERMQKN
ncbi:MAG: D-glycero-beta-D-manno-heptose 1-phosphate adenylyltransferase [Deltaproteobacteria bacterium]|nr:D-glycero-beta-D-manno-heptose 1-phosphate adenylyltransferase [Deltaproteobacteria bacterium]